MPTLTVIANGSTHEIAFSRGHSLREILESAGLLVRSACRGNGACGLCLVQIESGAVAAPTRTEGIFLTAEQLAGRIRLACQLMPENDLSVRLLNIASKSHWRELNPRYLHCNPLQLEACPGAKLAATAYGLAIDLGTTNLAFSLWDLGSRRRIASRSGPNPQSGYGADVISRLVAAVETPDNVRALARLPLVAIADGLREMCARGGLNPENVTQVVIVGNSAMLVLLTGTDSQQLLQPHSWTQPVACPLNGPQEVLRTLGLHPEAGVDVIPPLAGFVGSDLLAGVAATGLMDRPSGLLIDFGTNSELALWDGGTLWVTSAAGGPAFESSEIRCGQPAEAGAIYGANWQPGSTELRLKVLGGGEAKGLCASGLVDLIAFLRASGALTPTGKLAHPYAKDGYLVCSGHPDIRLANRDIDAFQRAKAAVGTGIQALLAKARIKSSRLSRICVCGAFGQDVNVHNAQSIGLLPEIPAERVEFCGNTALTGCERLLMSGTQTAEFLSDLRMKAKIINLSELVNFEALFMGNLFLQPLRVDET